MSGAWLCTHIWQRYDFTSLEDEEFLQRMFPVLRGSVVFMLDFLIEDFTGKTLITSPSLSPENTYIDEKGQRGVLCEGSAIDIQTIDCLFSIFLLSVKHLGITDDLCDSVEIALQRLSPMKFGSYGQLYVLRALANSIIRR